MKLKNSISFALTICLVTQPALAQDDPAATIKAQTDLLSAQTAQTNAQTAQINAQAARDKAQVDRLGLPSFENKTTLQEGGGAIETAMLSTRALSKAAEIIADKTKGECVNDQSPTIVVLAGNQQLQLNAGRVVTSQLNYFKNQFTPPPPKKLKFFAEALSLPLAVKAATAIAGLFGNETTVTGVPLPEIDNHLLANAVAGKLERCAILPSAGAGIIDLDHDPIAQLLGNVLVLRNDAAIAVQNSKAKEGSPEAARIERLKAGVTEFDTFYKQLSKIGEDGQSPLMQAILADRIALIPQVKLLRVAVDRAGGTISNSKNIRTFFGSDPVRVSGGLVLSYVLVDARTGQVVKGGSLACQTAQVRLRDVQSGRWSTQDDNGKRLAKGTASCS